MPEYIERSALIDWFRPYGQSDEPIPFESLVEYARDVAPAADVEMVVRCKDCEHWEGHGKYGNCTEWKANDNECAETDPDDFCSYGERKEARTHEL